MNPLGAKVIIMKCNIIMIIIFIFSSIDVEIIGSFVIVLASPLTSTCQSQNFTDIIPDTKVTQEIIILLLMVVMHA